MAQREGGLLAAPRLAHGGEPGERGEPRVLGPDHNAPFLGLHGLLPEIPARIAGEVGVEVDQAGQHGLALEVDLAVGLHRSVAGGDAGDPAIGDKDRRRAARFAGGIGDDRAGADRDGLGGQRRGGRQQGDARDQGFAEMVHVSLSPRVLPSRDGARADPRQESAPYQKV